MAIVLREPAPRPGWGSVRLALVLVATLILLGGVALSGGFQLPELEAGVGDPGLAEQRPVFDGRGKWTGYAR